MAESMKLVPYVTLFIAWFSTPYIADTWTDQNSANPGPTRCFNHGEGPGNTCSDAWCHCHVEARYEVAVW